MSAGFTPGPWRIDGLRVNEGWGANEGEDSIEIACLPHDAFDALEVFGKRRDLDSYAEFVANARLIAAAPELYEEAEFLCARLRELECDVLDDEVGRQYYGHCSPSRARLESILAKARGDA